MGSAMGNIPVVLYREPDGSVPFLEWFERLPEKAQDKCHVRLERLSSLCHELRRPEAGYLRDGIYELRVRVRSSQYRILYFFQGRIVAVLAHGKKGGSRTRTSSVQSGAASSS